MSLNKFYKLANKVKDGVHEQDYHISSVDNRIRLIIQLYPKTYDRWYTECDYEKLVNDIKLYARPLIELIK